MQYHNIATYANANNAALCREVPWMIPPIVLQIFVITYFDWLFDAPINWKRTKVSFSQLIEVFQSVFRLIVILSISRSSRTVSDIFLFCLKTRSFTYSDILTILPLVLRSQGSWWFVSTNLVSLQRDAAHMTPILVISMFEQHEYKVSLWFIFENDILIQATTQLKKESEL